MLEHSREQNDSSYNLDGSMSSRRFTDAQMAKIKRLILEKHQLKKDLNDVRKILLMDAQEFTKHEYLAYRIKKLNDMWPRLKQSVYPKFGTD